MGKPGKKQAVPRKIVSELPGAWPMGGVKGKAFAQQGPVATGHARRPLWESARFHGFQAGAAIEGMRASRHLIDHATGSKDIVFW